MSDENINPEIEGIVALTADIVSAHVSNNNVPVADLPTLISSVYAALTGLDAAPEPEPVKQEPAVSLRASVKPDYIVCLEDGKKLKMLKRYLRTNFDMSPDEYRRKWGLPSDYPMVAPNYAEKRRTLAHSIGLGRKSAPAETPAPEPEPEEVVAPAPRAKRGRPAKVAAPAPTEEPVRKPRAKKVSGAEALAKARGETVEG
ncbi:MucR family transcriptional regulator [Sphingomonas profundi]|uniref:MucR family transcriptional regulator n=1 Tax=Alterirhizorhabdus profundi TaxID=2681549 RepID=UPI0012E7DFEC|nr:MucR family transcriptional regulator [Sphingomonas profundi]